ncbi:hypothetical protein Tco_1220859 [Tanacetum coccineum]
MLLSQFHGYQFVHSLNRKWNVLGKSNVYLGKAARHRACSHGGSDFAASALFYKGFAYSGVFEVREIWYVTTICICDIGYVFVMSQWEKDEKMEVGQAAERNSTAGDNVHGMLFGVSAELTAPVTLMFFSEIPGLCSLPVVIKGLHLLF